MSIYDVIRDDHVKVAQLFEDIREAKDPDDRFALFESLREELTVHAKAEEDTLYRRLKPKMGEKIGHSYEEHEGMVTLMAQIQDLEPEDRRFERLIADLQQAVEHHVREEESAVLPQARQILGEDADDKIAVEFLRAKGAIQERDFEPV